jgi:hypothetical protein
MLRRRNLLLKHFVVLVVPLLLAVPSLASANTAHVSLPLKIKTGGLTPWAATYTWNFPVRQWYVASTLFVESATWTAAIQWNRAGTRLGIEWLPLETHQAIITFTPKNGYTMTADQLKSFVVPSAATVAVDPNLPRTIIATFPQTSNTKQYRIFTDLNGNTALRNATLVQRTNTTEQWIASEHNTWGTKLSEMMQPYNQDILPIVRDHFAPLPDVDENGTVDVFVATLPENIAGYVYYADQSLSAYAQGWNSPNFGETVYIDASLLNRTNNYVFLRVLVHELQHVANRGLSDAWLNEALSEAASHMYALKRGLPGLQENINAFNARPDRFSRNATIWYGDDLSYAKSYLFAQYVRTRIEAKYGKNTNIRIFNEIIHADISGTSKQAITSVIRKYLHTQYTFDQFYNEFEQALKRKDASGIYGFNGETFFNGLK